MSEWNTTSNPANDGGVAHCCAIFHVLRQLTNCGLAQGLGGEQRPHPLCGTKDATGHRAGAEQKVNNDAPHEKEYKETK